MKGLKVFFLSLLFLSLFSNSAFGLIVGDRDINIFNTIGVATDTNASTACTLLEYLAGDGSCYNVSGAGGGGIWVDSGNYAGLNGSAVQNINVSGYGNFSQLTVGGVPIFSWDEVNLSGAAGIDTNASTACSGAEYLAGDGSCVTIVHTNLTSADITAFGFSIGIFTNLTGTDILGLGFVNDSYVKLSNRTLFYYVNATNISMKNYVDAVATDNTSWNQAVANALYGTHDAITGNASNATLNAEVYTNATNSSMFSWVDAIFAKISDVQTWINGNNTNATLEAELYTNATNITMKDYVDAVSGDNASWNQAVANALYGTHDAITGNISAIVFTNLTGTDILDLGFVNDSYVQLSNRTLFYYVNATNISMKNYVDTVGGDNTSWNQAVANALYSSHSAVDGNNTNATLNAEVYTNATNLSMKSYVDDNLETKYNITGGVVSGDVNVTGTIRGRPVDGVMGSGIIWADKIDSLGNILVNHTVPGLRVAYPNLTVRLAKTDNTVKYCNISGGNVSVPNNAHTVYYVDSNCAVQSTSMDTYINTDLSPGGIADFMNVFAHSGDVEVHEGSELKSKEDIKIKKKILRTDHLEVVSGLGTTTGTFNNYTLGSGEYVYILDIVDSTTQNDSLGAGGEFIYHNGGVWNYSDQNGINLTHCDDGADLVSCSNPSKYRRYYVFTTGFEDGEDETERHQLASVDSETFANVGACLDTTASPISYTLPSFYDFVAVPIFAYCGTPGDSGWTGSFIDLRTVAVGSAASGIDTSIFLTRDGQRTLTQPWNANQNISAPWFNGGWNGSKLQLGDIFISGWSEINFTDNSSWNQIVANALYSSHSAVDGNNTNATLNAELYTNATNISMKDYVDAVAGDNESWNQIVANALYSSHTAVDGNNTNATLNAEVYTNTTNISMKSYVDAVGGDNESWNQIVANALYSSHSAVDGNNTNATLNAELYTNATNITMKDYVDAVAGDNSSWNQAVANALYSSHSAVDGNNTNATLNAEVYTNATNISMKDYVDAVSGDNESWNQAVANALYGTHDAITGNISAIVFTNLTGTDILDLGFVNDSYVQLSNRTLFYYVNATNVSMKSYAEFLNKTLTLRINSETGDNASWNQAVANALYSSHSAVDGNNTNATLNAEVYTNATNISMKDYVDAVAGDNTTWNQIVANALYSSHTAVDGNNTNATLNAEVYTNATNSSMFSWVDAIFTKISDVQTWINGNNTNATLNAEAYTNATNITMKDYVDAVGGDNTSWNQIVANALYGTHDAITGNISAIVFTNLSKAKVRNFTGWNLTGTNVILTTGTNSVGVGTETPTSQLTVVGNMNATNITTNRINITLNMTLFGMNVWKNASGYICFNKC